MFTKANLEIYNIDVEDIITVSGEGEDDLGKDSENDKLPTDEF